MTQPNRESTTVIELVGFPTSEHTWKVKLAADALGVESHFWSIDGPPAARSLVPGPPHLVPMGRICAGDESFPPTTGSDVLCAGLDPDQTLCPTPAVKESHDRIEGELSPLVNWLLWVDPKGFQDKVVAGVRAQTFSFFPAFIVRLLLKETIQRRTSSIKDRVGFPNYPEGYDRTSIERQIDAFAEEMDRKLSNSPTGWLDHTEKLSLSDITLYVHVVQLAGANPLYKRFLTGELLSWYTRMQNTLTDFDPMAPDLKATGKFTKKRLHSWSD